MRFSSRWFVATAMALLATGGFVAAFAQQPEKPTEAKSAVGETYTIELQLDEKGVLQLQAKPDATYEAVAELLKTMAGALEKEGKHPKIKVKTHGHEVSWKEFTALNCQSCHTNVPAKEQPLTANVTFSLDETCQPGVAQWLQSASVASIPVTQELALSRVFDAVNITQVQPTPEEPEATVDFTNRVQATDIFVAAPAWSVTQATGAPNTFVYGDQNTAWASKTPNGQGEWLILTYETPVDVNAVMIHETYNPGAVARVDAILPDNEVIVLWSGEPEAVKTNTPRLFFCKPKKSVKAAKIRVTIASDVVAGWNEIDAVGILDGEGKVHWAKEATASSCYSDGGKTGEGASIEFLRLVEPTVIEPAPEVALRWLSEETKAASGVAEVKEGAIANLQGLLLDRSKAAPVQGESVRAVDLLLNSQIKEDAAKADIVNGTVEVLNLKLADPTTEPAKSDSEKLKQIEAELEGLLKQLATLRAKMKSK